MGCKTTGLVNLSRNHILAENVHIASSFSRRLKGLIGKACLPPEEAMIILPCNSVHTFFMRFPIDVIFVDKNAVIIHIIEKLKPYKFSPIIKGSYLVIELAAGRIAETGTAVGDQLQLNLMGEIS
ncbi:MAG: DUF192 domain-containing protein [Peptococcaceae bacterium]|jgi:hypothetical protein|nr:MAG: DUF192 domain-containing protein [Peptococcaceae bacterium]